MLDQAYSRRQFLGLAGGLASIVGLGLVGCGGSNAANTAAEGSAAAAESVSGEVTYDGASSFQALVEPKSKNVTDDSFKIWATEHMYCSKDADEATKAFLEFMLSDDVQGKLVEEQGFIPVSAMKVVKDASGKVSAK